MTDAKFSPYERIKVTGSVKDKGAKGRVVSASPSREYFTVEFDSKKRGSAIYHESDLSSMKKAVKKLHKDHDKPYPGYTTEEEHRKRYPNGSPQGLTQQEKDEGYVFYPHGHRVQKPAK